MKRPSAPGPKTKASNGSTSNKTHALRSAAHQARQLAATLVATLHLLRQEADVYTRRRLLAALLLVLAGSVLAALGPLALRALVDTLAGTAPSSSLAHPALVFGAAYLLALGGVRVLTDLRPLFSGAAEQRLHARLSRRFLGHLMSLPMGFHADRPTGALVQALAQAAVGCQLLLATAVSGMAPVVAEVALVLVVLAHLDQPALALSFAVTAVVYLIVSSIAAFRLQVQAAQVADASLQAHASLADTLVNVEPIKCQGAESAMAKRYAAATSRLEERWVDLYRQRAGTGLLLTAVFSLSMATSLAIAVQAYTRGSLSLGGFVLVTVYLLQLIRPLETLSTALRDLAQALAFVRPVLTVLQLPAEAPGAGPGCRSDADANPHTQANTGPPTSTSATSALPRAAPIALSLRGVHLSYSPQARVLRGLDLEVAAGRTLGIVGASGAGKTSLVRLLLRLYPAQSGCILVDGRPIEELPLAELRAVIGLVPQDTLLLDASIADNITLGRPGVPSADIEQAACVAQLSGLISSLPQGYDTPVGERGLKLSGGERQRIAIARVALRRPRLLLLDEATSMLDAHTEAAVLQGLKQLGQGSTTLIIAHRLRALAHADEVVVLGEGRVQERGSPAALRAAGGLYARLWLAQMGREPARGTPAAVPPRPSGLH